MQYFTNLLHFKKHIAAEILFQTTFVRRNSEFDSWVNTALDIISSNPNTERGNPKQKHTRIILKRNQYAPKERRLGIHIAEHIRNKKLFYGIELAARSYSIPMTLDFNKFHNHQPLFTSLIWLGKEHRPSVRLMDVDVIRFALQLRGHTIVLPHFACNSADHTSLTELMTLNFGNVFVIRGNFPPMEQQDFSETADLVREIRRLKGDTISIGVGGYPEGHMEARTVQENMEMLMKKVDAGADYIMTRICFCSSTVIHFIKNCRDYGITIPIIVGIYIPESVSALRYVGEFTHAMVSPADIAQYDTNADNPKLFHEYAKRQTVHLISDILESKLDIYGFQFFTMNSFTQIYDVMNELHANYDARGKLETELKENITDKNENVTIDKK